MNPNPYIHARAYLYAHAHKPPMAGHHVPMKSCKTKMFVFKNILNQIVIFCHLITSQKSSTALHGSGYPMILIILESHNMFRGAIRVVYTVNISTKQLQIFRFFFKSQPLSLERDLHVDAQYCLDCACHVITTLVLCMPCPPSFLHHAYLLHLQFVIFSDSFPLSLVTCLFQENFLHVIIFLRKASWTCARHVFIFHGFTTPLPPTPILHINIIGPQLVHFTYDM